MQASASTPVMATSTPSRKAATWSPSQSTSSSTRPGNSNAPSTPHTPARPPAFPHSTSSPSLPTSSSLPHLSSPNPGNASANQKNYHPYLIQSTSSSLLTRSNSSPSQPIHALGRHRPSRSMSSLAHAAMSEGDLSNGEEREERRKSMESPLAGGRRIVRSSRSGTLPSFLEEGASPQSKANRWVELPTNPKQWSPSELATYLDQTLRYGGQDGTGQRLPGPLVEDIKSWVLRQQITGRAFLRGNADTWGSSSRPPPFLPMLLTLSRRLRRASLQGNPPDVLDSASSVLLETDEEDDEVTGVRRMADRFEARDSMSEMSDMEEERAIRAQLTGGNEGWERWGLRRQNTGGSMGGRRRGSVREDEGRLGETLGLGSSREEVLVTPLLEHKESSADMASESMKQDEVEEEEDEGGPGGTLKAHPAGLVEPSPPPPYTSPAPGVDNTIVFPSRLQPGPTDGTPRTDRPRTEITPTPDHPKPTSEGLGFSPDRPEQSLSVTSPLPRASPAGSRYGSLRTKSRVPSLRGRKDESGYDTSDEASRASRKVTLRPSHAHIATIFDLESKSPREMELEKQLEEVLERVKVLEGRLEAVSRPVSPSPSGLAPGEGGVVPTGTVGYLLGKIGLGPVDDAGGSGLPTRVGELPGYLFLVGVGVGAVMVRVLLGRGR